MPRTAGANYTRYSGAWRPETPHTTRRKDKYSSDQLNEAVRLARSGMSVKNALDTVQVRPQGRSALQQVVYRRLRDDDPTRVPSTVPLGRPSVLTQEEEESLVQQVNHFVSAGSPISYDVIREMGLDLLHKRCKDADLGPRWAYRFVQRHAAEIRQRKGAPTDKMKTRVLFMGPEDLTDWFTTVSALYGKHLISPCYLESASRVVYLDEIGLKLDERGECIVVPTRTRQISEGECPLTAVFAFTAAGATLPPVYIVRGVKDDEQRNKLEQNLSFPGSKILAPPDAFQMKNSWRSVVEHLVEHFRTWGGPEDDIILFWDGDNRHAANIETLEYLRENSIYAAAVPSSHITTQFAALKQSMQRCTTAVTDRLAGRVVVCPTDMITLIDEILSQGIPERDDIRHSFEVTGLFPLRLDYLRKVAHRDGFSPFSWTCDANFLIEPPSAHEVKVITDRLCLSPIAFRRIIPHRTHGPSDDDRTCIAIDGCMMPSEPRRSFDVMAPCVNPWCNKSYLRGYRDMLGVDRCRRRQLDDDSSET